MDTDTLPPVQDRVSLMQAPIMEHFQELRRRLIFCLAIFLVLFALSYVMAEPIYQFLVHPLAEVTSEKHRLIYTALTEAFMTYIKVAFFSAFFLSFPIIAIQIYRFLAPGLYRHEKKAIMPFLVAVPVLFLMGAALAYYAVIPWAWKFFLGFETPATEGGLPIQLEARVSDYLQLVMQLIIAFGMAFQLPVVLVLLTKAGVISSQFLVAKRRIAIVLIFTAGAVLTPPDILSQIALSIPLWMLYESSIFACRLVEKKRQRQTDSAEADNVGL